MLELLSQPGDNGVFDLQLLNKCWLFEGRGEFPLLVTSRSTKTRLVTAAGPVGMPVLHSLPVLRVLR